MRWRSMLLELLRVLSVFGLQQLKERIPIPTNRYWDMNDGTRSYFASPDPSNGMRYMFGGNFIYTSDSRLPGGNAIKVHDRRE